jgi:hypothetical protein
VFSPDDIGDLIYAADVRKFCREVGVLLSAKTRWHDVGFVIPHHPMTPMGAMLPWVLVSRLDNEEAEW